MIKNNKQPCNNVSTETYTGKEQSPKRFGLSAEGYDLNFEKEGYDGKIWIVQIKNNRKVWVRKNIITKITHEEPLITIDANDNGNNNDNSNGSNDSGNANSDDNGNGDDNCDDDKKPEIIEEPVVEIAVIPEVTVEKKKTDYNIFIKYYLDKLKKEDTNKTPNKILFQQTTQEWSRLKNNPSELKILMEQIKK
jgi:hypothetical protein